MTARCSPPCPARSPCPSPSRFRRRAITRPGTDFFQTAVCTSLPCHSTSRGRPTFTDTTELTLFPSRRNSVAHLGCHAGGNVRLKLLISASGAENGFFLQTFGEAGKPPPLP